MISRIVKRALLEDKPRQSVAGAALIISLFGIASRVLGLLRDRILAGQFGAGDTLDAYYAAFRIPDLMYNLMIVGALSAAFIPVFTELIANKKEGDAWKLSSGVLSLQICITAAISVIVVVFAVPVMKMVTPGFTGQKLELTVYLTRIMLLSSFLFGISGIIGGVLVSFKKFLVYSLAPIFYNIGIIIGAVFFVRLFGPVGLAWGVVLGALLHMLVQYPAVRRSGFRFNPGLKSAMRNPEVRKVIRLMVPRTLTIAVTQVSLTISTVFASTLAPGSLAVFTLANNIQSAPLGLFGVSFSIAVLPALSAFVARGENDKFVQTYSKTLRQILFFVIPASVFLFMLRAQIVRIALGSGQFNWDNTVATLTTLGILTVGLFAQSIIPLFTRMFYALQNTKIPFYIAIVSEVFNVAATFILIRPYGVFGLAGAFSLGSVFNMGLLYIYLKKQVGDLDEQRVLRSTLSIIVASVCAGFAVQIAKEAVGTAGELDTFIAVLSQFVVAGGLGAVTFAIACHYLKIEEYHQLVLAMKRKLFKEKKAIQEDMHEVAGA